MKILISLLISVTLFALSEKQKQNIIEAYNVAKLVKAKDGFSFENTVTYIMLQESSAGLELIGDKYKNGKLKPLLKSSIGIMQIKVSTARETIRKTPFLKKHFSNLLTDDKRIINMLLTSSEFSSLIASHYLVRCYEEAKRKGYSNPYFRAISRYNGGWNNQTYYSKIMKRKYFIKDYGFKNGKFN